MTGFWSDPSHFASLSPWSSGSTDRKACVFGADRDGRIAEAWRERREDEIAAKHLEIGVGGKAMRLPQRSQRLDNEIVGDERTARDAEHGCIRDAKALGGNRRTEIDLVTHDNIRRPLAADTDDRRCSFAGDATSERHPNRASLALQIDRDERTTLIRGQQARTARPKGCKPLLLDRRDHPFLPRKRNDMTGPRSRPSDRRERQKVPRSPRKREQDPHPII